MKLFVLYRLRAGIAFQDYERWSREHDRPALDGTPEILAFDVHAVEPVQGEGGFQVVEMIEVASWQDWEAATKTDAIRALGPDFERMVDPASLVILRGERIAPTA
jgi:hypothetical protein